MNTETKLDEVPGIWSRTETQNLSRMGRKISRVYWLFHGAIRSYTISS